MNMEDRNRKKRIGVWSIVLVVVLLGGILTAVLLSGNLPNEKEKHEDTKEQTQEQTQEQTREQTQEQCKKLLNEEKYQDVAALYDAVSEYPEFQAEIERQLKAHVAQAVTEQNVKRVPKVYHALQTSELLGTLMDGISEGADALYEDSCGDFMIFHQALTEEQFYLEELDQRVLDHVRAEVEAKDYTDASTYIRIVYHCEACVAWLQQFHEDLMESYLERCQYEDAVLLYSHMDYVDLKDDKVGAIWLKYAYALMDEEKYADAQYLLFELRDREHAVYDLDAQFAFRLVTLYVYIEKGELVQAREWANSFYGETRDKLLEVLKAYTGDQG